MTRAGRIGPGIAVAVALAVASVALSAAPRVLLASGSLPAPARAFIWSDVLATYVERLGGTKLPYFDAFFEYPPLIGYVSGALVRLTGDAVSYVAAWATVCAIAAGAVALLVARQGGSAAVWALSPQLLLYGAMNFDTLAVLFLVWAIALSAAGHRFRALASLAIGTMIKAFPVLAAPPELAELRRRGWSAALTSLVVFGGIVLVVAAPSLIAPHPFAEGAAYIGRLTNFDSAWGLVLAALQGLGFTGAEGPVAIASAVGGIAMYVWALWRSRGSDLARAAALTMIAVLLWTRLYSPQYSLWVVPFFALGVLPLRAFAVLSIADVVVFASVYPLTIGAGDPAPAWLPVLLAFGILLRHAALIWAWWVAVERTVGPST